MVSGSTDAAADPRRAFTASGRFIAPAAAAAEGDASSLAVTQQFALVDADIVMNYRVRDRGLLDWLAFSGDSRLRRSA